MRNTTKILFSGALIGALAFTSVAQAEGEQQVAPAETVPQTPAQQNPAQGVPQTPAQQDPTQMQTQGAPESAVPQDPTQTRPQVDPAAPDAAQQQPKEPYEVTEFFSDAQRYTVGSQVPEKYRAKSYEITEWQKRHLPAPDAGSHWTYMGGNYVLISNADGKIIKAKSGDIFFH